MAALRQQGLVIVQKTEGVVASRPTPLCHGGPFLIAHLGSVQPPPPPPYSLFVGGAYRRQGLNLHR